ncbi:hypothetical protein Lser_V15G07330 [Lactuca serriola]
MGKKRITYDCNEDDHKPPNQVIIDHHHHHNHHHHHRHNNHQKSKKIKPDAKLLHTLSSHLKKLDKSRSRNTHFLSTPPPPPPPATTISHEKRKLSHDHQCDRDHHRVWFRGIDRCNHEKARHDDGDHDMGVFEFGKDLCWKTLLSENNEDLFGGDCVFAPDLNASRKMVVVFEEDRYGCGSYIPDPVMHWNNGDEGNCLYDILELSSQEDMINEFLKVNLFVS